MEPGEDRFWGEDRPQHGIMPQSSFFIAGIFSRGDDFGHVNSNLHPTTSGWLIYISGGGGRKQ